MTNHQNNPTPEYNVLEQNKIDQYKPLTKLRLRLGFTHSTWTGFTFPCPYLLLEQFKSHENHVFRRWVIMLVREPHCLIGKDMFRESISKMKNRNVQEHVWGLTKSVGEARLEMVADLISLILAEERSPVDWELSTIVDFCKGEPSRHLTAQS